MNGARPILSALRRAPAPMPFGQGSGGQPFAARYVGIPFAAKGYGFEGCNCWGLVSLVYERERGLELPRHEEAYGAELLGPDARLADLRSLAGIVAGRIAPDWREVAFHEARVFDVFLLPIAAQPCHVAIYAGDLHILHVEEGIDSMCEDLREPRWHKRLERARLFTYAGAPA